MDFKDVVAAWMSEHHVRGYIDQPVIKVKAFGYESDGTFDTGNPDFRVTVTTAGGRWFDFEGEDMQSLWNYVMAQWPVAAEV